MRKIDCGIWVKVEGLQDYKKGYKKYIVDEHLLNALGVGSLG